MTGTANPLSAKAAGTSDWAGIYLAEDVQTLDQAFRSGSWIDGAIGGFGATMDTLGLITDPLGTLASWGVAWLEEHVKPLREALNKLAGNPAQISADAQSWRNVGKSATAQASAMKSEVAAESHWRGDAAAAYYDHAGQQWSALDALAKAADTLGTITEGAGLVVALVRTMVRDLIADFVSTLAVRLPEWLAEEGLTLGIATPWVAAQVDSLVGKWVARITRLLKALISTMRRLAPILRRLREIVGELRAVLRRVRTEDKAPGPQPWDPNRRILKASPIKVRPRIGDKGDIAVDPDGMVHPPSAADMRNLEVQGMSTFDTVENMIDAGVTSGKVREPGAPLPDGLAIVADGRDVGGRMPPGHATIYPTRPMSLEEFQRLVDEMQWENIPPPNDLRKIVKSRDQGQ